MEELKKNLGLQRLEDLLNYLPDNSSKASFGYNNPDDILKIQFKLLIERKCSK